MPILSLTLPIFLLIALGFGAVRFGVVPADFIRGLGGFVLNFALPALVLTALLGQDLRQTFEWSFVLAYGGGSLVVFIAAMLLFRSVFRRDISHASIASLGGVASNSGFVGFPIAALALGAPALTALPLAMLVENVLIIPLALGLAEAGKHGGARVATLIRHAVSRLVRMPLFLAIALGIALSVLGMGLPGVMATALGMVANASTACALFVVGGTLAMLDATALGSDIAWIAVIKLVVHPIAVVAGFWLLGDVEPRLMAAGIVLASAPMLTVYPIFGQRFGLGGLAAAALLAATAASFITMSIALWLLAIEPRQAWLTAPDGGQIHWKQGGPDG